MGLIIISNETKLETHDKKDDSCIVCNIENPERYANELEKIFHTLNSLPRNELADADSKMCEFHKKKSQSLTIIDSQDEYLELDSATALMEKPKANFITQEEYEKTEIENEV
jgi:hypothetical protein